MSPAQPLVDPTAPLWRALAIFRGVALAYAALLYATVFDEYARPVGGWLVLAGLLVWSVVVSDAYRRTRGTATGWLLSDLMIAVAAVLVTRWLDDPTRIEAGEQTLPTIWVAAPVLAWAIARGWRGGLFAAAVVAAADIIERGSFARTTVHNMVLLVLAGLIVGYAVDLFRRSDAALQQSLRIEAATRERERLARGIHDGVLQVLALVQRRGREIGGETAELARLAGEQEAALRTLVSSSADVLVRGSDTDLRTLLAAHSSVGVTISAPATPVLLPAECAAELAAAVAAALDNVAQHAGPGAHTWVLVEDDLEAVTISIRDDGAGMSAERLTDAAAAGRLGAVQSIRGRLRDLGGEATWTSAIGEGTEVELRLPRQASGRTRP
ncbi:MAG: DUF5931 domain-containing protein [Candidatus Nanopelagicales bacterium]